MIKSIAAFVSAVCLAAPAAAVNVNWADWQSTTGTTQVNGVMDDNGTTINVTFTSTSSLSPAAQLNGGTDYWASGAFGASGRVPARSPYTNSGSNPVNNIPTGTDIIRMSSQSTYTLTFDKLVSDIYLAFVSLNRNAWTFNTQAILLSAGGMNVDGAGVDDRGYWGSTTTTAISTPSAGQWVLSGNGEPHGTILLPGSFTSVSWTGGGENWHGFTIGVEGVTVPPVPLPAGGWLLLTGLAGLALKRRLLG